MNPLSQNVFLNDNEVYAHLLGYKTFKVNFLLLLLPIPKIYLTLIGA